MSLMCLDTEFLSFEKKRKNFKDNRKEILIIKRINVHENYQLKLLHNFNRNKFN